MAVLIDNTTIEVEVADLLALVAAYHQPNKQWRCGCGRSFRANFGGRWDQNASAAQHAAHLHHAQQEALRGRLIV